LLLLPAAASAQESSCTLELSALVKLPNASLVQRLGVDGFAASSKKGPVRIESVETDHGPRRILFVVENGKDVPAPARKIEAAILSEILSNARAEDSFALLTTKELRKEIRFDTGMEALQVAVKEIETSVPDKSKEAAVLDTVLQAIDWFQPCRAGDAIFVLTMGMESSHPTRYSKVWEALGNAHIRLFGVQLGEAEFFVKTHGPVSVIGMSTPGQLSADIIPGGPVTIDMSQNGRVVTEIATVPREVILENLFSLSRGTGGFAGLVNLQGEPWKKYKLTDDRLRAIRYIGLQEYKAMEEYYRIRIQRPPQRLFLDLAPAIRQQVPEARVIYAKSALDCSPGSTPPPH
jgi:hypothetical protein